MKIGLRIPSLRKRVAARLSWKRFVRHSLGFKTPRTKDASATLQKLGVDRALLVDVNNPILKKSIGNLATTSNAKTPSRSDFVE